MKKNNVYVTDVRKEDFENTHVSVDDIVAFINDKTVFHANILKNKDRIAIYDRNAKHKCAEFAFRNKTNTFSCALQCNRFAHENIRIASDTINATYKYHNCKNSRNYMTVNDVDVNDAMNFLFELFDSVIDN